MRNSFHSYDELTLRQVKECQHKTLELALVKVGCVREISKVAQGSLFTNAAWFRFLELRGIRFNIDGKGLWIEKAVVEQLKTEVKREEVYLWESECVNALELQVEGHFEDYNNGIPRVALDRMSQWQFCRSVGERSRQLVVSKREAERREAMLGRFSRVTRGFEGFRQSKIAKYWPQERTK